MLDTPPSVNSDAVRMWNRMHPLNVTYFAHYYELAYNSSVYQVPFLPLWDNSSYGTVIYDQWD